MVETALSLSGLVNPSFFAFFRLLVFFADFLAAIEFLLFFWIAPRGGLPLYMQIKHQCARQTSTFGKSLCFE